MSTNDPDSTETQPQPSQEQEGGRVMPEPKPNFTSIGYFHFWETFQSGNSECARKFFNPLLLPFQNKMERQVCVVNVFPEWPPHIMEMNRHCYWISHSGESYTQPLKDGLYDAHLIMEETNLAKRIISCPLFSIYAYEENAWPRLMEPRTLPTPNPKTKFCAMTVSNDRGIVRNKFFNLLNGIRKVDSMGNCFNNMAGYKLPKGKENCPITLGSYQFILCFENNIKTHYLTEKLLHAYLAGAIPIYGGAKIAQEWLNPNAFLYLEEDTPQAMEKLARQVLYLADNEEAYRKIYEQPLLRTKQIPPEMSIEFIRYALEQIPPLYVKETQKQPPS